VYEFSGTEGGSYYSVSQISETKQAVPLIPDKPYLEPIEYEIYNANPNLDTTSYQKMVLNWDLPSSTIFIGVTSFSILLSVNDEGYDIIANDLPSSDRSFTYQVASQYLTTPSRNKLDFIVIAYYGEQQYSSDPQFCNTFTFATAPQELTCRYAIPENDGVDTDIVFSFKNPLNKGQGNGYKFIYDIMVGLASVATGYVDYDADYTGFYSVSRTIPTQLNGTINVRLETENTNVDPSKPYVGGAVQSASYIVVGVPIVESISIDADTGYLLVQISSGDILGLYNKIIYINASGFLTEKSFETTSDSSSYAVNVVTSPIDGTITYFYTFTPAYFVTGSIPTNLIVCASNEAGIGSGIYPTA
jgi:hypothetical protein